MSSSAIVSVIAASASAVAKVFVIGSIGGLCVVVPKKAPFLPRHLVSSVARFCFHALTIPLIYSTIAIAVSIDTVGDYWFLIVGGWVVLSISYLLATVLQCCCFKIKNQSDFHALRVAATYPNIVALPILIFPSLCEFEVVQEGYAQDYSVTYSRSSAETAAVGGGNEEDITATTTSEIDLQRECIAQSTTMIFCYFFAWSLAFWSFGYPQLKNAAAERTNNNRDGVDEGGDDDNTTTAVEQLDTTVATTVINSSTRADIQITSGISHHPSVDSMDMTMEVESDNVASDNTGGKSPTKHADENDHSHVENEKNVTTTNFRGKIDDPVDNDQGDVIKDNSEDDEEEGTAQFSIERSCADARDSKQASPEQDRTESLEPMNQRMGCSRNISASLLRMWTAVKQTCTSPGFIAMLLAFITACIPPLQRALFEPGGWLRWFGSAMETLGQASSPLSTIVVAASLVPPRRTVAIQREDGGSDEAPANNHQNTETDEDAVRRRSTIVIDERPGMTDPNFGPYQRRRNAGRRSRLARRSSAQFVELRRSLRSSSIRILNAVSRSTPEMWRLHVWFILSRLIVTPAVVVGLILGLDCSGSALLSNVPSLAKLVIIVNSALPGALIVVVLLKSDEKMANTAAAVSKVYLPSYLISIVTIAAWTAVGLYITILDEDGKTFCQS